MPQSLAAAFAAVPDPRRAASVIDPLPAILALAVAAMLANHHSVLAIAEWGARQCREVLRALGFPTGCPPCQSTLPRLVAKLDGDALSAILTAHFAQATGPGAAGLPGVAIDGKAPRGRLPFPGGAGSGHALSAFGQDRGIVLADEPVEPTRGPDHPDTAAAALNAAPALLARIDWPDQVLTGDALPCQRAHCRQVLGDGGD